MPSFQKPTPATKESVSVGSTPVGKGQTISPAVTPSEPQATTPQQPEQKEQKVGFFSRLFKSKETNVQKQEPIGRLSLFVDMVY